MASYFCVKSTPWYLSYLQTLHCKLSCNPRHNLHCKLSCNPRHNLHCNLCHNLLLLLTHPVQVQRVQTCEGLFSNWLNNSTSNYQNHYLWVVFFFKFNYKIFLLLLSSIFQIYYFSEKAEKIVKDILIFYQDTEIQLFTYQSTAPVQIWV